MTINLQCLKEKNDTVMAKETETERQILIWSRCHTGRQLSETRHRATERGPARIPMVDPSAHACSHT